jgi:hypothetical protein
LLDSYRSRIGNVQIEPARALEFHLVVNLLDGFLRRHVMREAELADGRLGGLPWLLRPAS